MLLVRIGIKTDQNLKTTINNCLCLVELGPESFDDPTKTSGFSAVGCRHLGHPWWYGGYRTGRYGSGVTVNLPKRSCIAGSLRSWARTSTL